MIKVGKEEEENEVVVKEAEKQEWGMRLPAA